MESFRVRYAAPDHQRKFMLALSLGTCSVTLLHILDHQLKLQTSKTGRTGFGLDVLFVDTAVAGNTPEKESSFAKIQEMYPDFSFASAPLHDVFTFPNTSLLRLLPGGEEAANGSAQEKLASLLDSLPSATARADVMSTLTCRLIVERAKAAGCEGILWGDCTTRLAERTLSETAKGRGYSLPWQVADGPSPFSLTFNYPLRDILKKELVSYVQIVEPSLSSIVYDSSAISQTSMSSKNTTIDDLMQQYFGSVEENFPSIVSNVVRTTGKLDAPVADASAPRCDLCNMPVIDGRFGIHGWGGNQQDGAESIPIEGSPKLCYGCTRSIPQLPGH